MKLSEAIRLGALLKPQGFGSRSGHSAAEHTCAMGAACEAAGLETYLTYDAMLTAWPFLKAQRMCPCPDGQPYDSAVSCRQLFSGTHTTIDLLWHLNDGHKWTREAIADWVESVERAHEPEALQALSLVDVGIE